jgi:hypothetical protein
MCLIICLLIIYAPMALIRRHGGTTVTNLQERIFSYLALIVGKR